MCIKENKLEIKKLVIGIGGASGVHLGLKFIENIPDSIELFVVISEGAKAVALNEMGEDIKYALDRIQYKRHFRIYNEDGQLPKGYVMTLYHVAQVLC